MRSASMRRWLHRERRKHGLSIRFTVASISLLTLILVYTSKIGRKERGTGDVEPEWNDQNSHTLSVNQMVQDLDAPFKWMDDASLFRKRAQSQHLLHPHHPNDSHLPPPPFHLLGDGSRYILSRHLLDEPDAETEKVAPNKTGQGASNFPPDLFTVEQRAQGAIIFHIMGLVYMFLALAIVCDEFFIPALDVITERMAISEDVAGATFMAAGGSAPELFTSIIGVFISKDDVGIGTIVGSAVFNILFVISMCAIFSKTVLELTWWPLFRDVSFYSIVLIVLMAFFGDNRIHWYESSILLSWYAAYVIFMKYNEKLEKCVKRLLNRSKVGSSSQGVEGNNNNAPSITEPAVTRRASAPVIHGGSNKVRQGVLQLMISSVDPLHEGEYDPAKFKENIMKNVDRTRDGTGKEDTSGSNGNIPSIHVTQQRSEEEKEVPLDVSWPKLWYKRVTYVILFPIIIPLWLTLPDVRRPEKRKFYAGSFIGSILWIAVFSYLMVWWATLVGDNFNVPPEVMGLTFLAAGTSIPDLITSVLVARKGFGDMAVSSSVGSNIFDVTVGLPFPWFLYSIIFGVVEVNSSGMACSIGILFVMLMIVIISIAAFKWKLNVGLACVMFLLYIVFMIVSLLLEKGVLQCTLTL